MDSINIDKMKVNYKGSQSDSIDETPTSSGRASFRVIVYTRQHTEGTFLRLRDDDEQSARLLISCVPMSKPFNLEGSQFPRL